MKIFCALFAIAGLLMAWIVGYALVQKVLPEFMVGWIISQIFTVIGLIGGYIRE